MRSLNSEDGAPLAASMLTRAIEGAQKKVEGYHFDIRKQLLRFDDVANVHLDFEAIPGRHGAIDQPGAALSSALPDRSHGYHPKKWAALYDRSHRTVLVSIRNPSILR